MSKLKYLLSFLVLIFLLQCKNSSDSQEASISLEEKIGQLIMVGFRGTEVSDSSLICQQIKEYNLGGVIFFEYDVPSGSRPRNVISSEQLKKLSSDLRKYGRKDIFIAVDEEGGLVSRLKARYGYQAAASPQYIGKLGIKDSTQLWASSIAYKVKNAGINVNFAPPVDLNVNPQSPVIGKIERSFSPSADSVTLHASIFIEEHKKKNILCSIKHFPGHGSATSDSHEGFTDVTDTWSDQELIPYKKMIEDSIVNAIMTSHVYHAQLDTVPATLSQNIIQGILREELNWNGIIMSDDMQMGAVTEHYGFEKGIELALNAGVDILLLSNNSATVDYDPELGAKTFKVIKQLVDTGKVSKERIEESYERVINLKKTFVSDFSK